ncbi:Putative auto-transporter adhesin, head GIN domain [Flexibacter flexilis DSM 6793]|uniref:Putative auto-transporter adhesin, head GIN domain n=1 Tax=Flexibacter flexilis DSM 6793 TaxID=927664 RepID=A0A1I1DJ39_9BACT|nr:head GIN domain-containing protein [Flexibacter flexilis]SFB74941.1 Putative auto-transporter adhesin, head GIN domain [Flexibacter flexilis DSM 6793]
MKKWFWLAAFALATCSNPDAPDCLKSTGHTKQISREVADFQRIVIDDNIDLYVTADTAVSLRLEGGENLLPSIKTDVNNGTLYIANHNKCNWVRTYKRKLKVFLHVKNLYEITQKGFGNIMFTNQLKTDNFTLNIYGVSEVDANINAQNFYTDINSLGTLRLSGQSNYAKFSLDKTPKLHTENFVVKSAYVHQGAETNITINCSDKLEGQILSTGNIFYKHNPVLAIVRKGEGQAIKID